MAQLERPATREHLGEFLHFIESECAQAKLPDDVSFTVRLAAEEACTNVIDHAYPPGEEGPLRVQFTADPGRVVVTLEDRAPRFAPDAVPAPDLGAAAEQRALGGLGWHLIRQVMDEVTHEYLDGRGNRLVLVKHLQPRAKEA